MADVFVSYARADEARVEMLVRAIEAHGVSVWWDRALEHGADFGDVIDREIDAAGAVVVCWSKTSATRQEGKTHWVRAEAQRAEDQQKYVGAVIEACAMPSPFNTLNAANLQAWSGAADDRALLALLRDVGRRIGRSDVAELADSEDRRLAEEERKRRAAAEAERVRLERERQQVEAARLDAANAGERARLAAARNYFWFINPVVANFAFVGGLIFIQRSAIDWDNPEFYAAMAVTILICTAVTYAASLFAADKVMPSTAGEYRWASILALICAGPAFAIVALAIGLAALLWNWIT